MLFFKDLAKSGGDNGYLPDVAREAFGQSLPPPIRLNFLIL
jgi:hypothetical protein